MKITWYGTASIGIETDKCKLLFDPFVPLKGSKVNVLLSDFDEFENIVITHAHLDHIASLPSLFLKKKREIFGTNATITALKKLGIPEENLHLIGNSKNFNIGDFSITAYKGKHIKYDKRTFFGTLINFRVLKYYYNFFPLLNGNKICKENGETVAYEIFAENKKIFLLGSLGFAENVKYPTNVDLLILPYQGTTDLLTPALAIIDTIKPKAVLLDHTDDTFPPLSRTINTDNIKNALKDKIPLYVIKQGENIII